MSEKFEYGTGRRKTATARTRIYAGSGGITVNGRSFEDYFPRKTLQMIIRQPLVLAKLADKPARVLTAAVRGMLPKNRLGRAMLKKLKIYAGTEHPHTAQNPQPLTLPH